MEVLLSKQGGRREHGEVLLSKQGGRREHGEVLLSKQGGRREHGEVLLSKQGGRREHGEVLLSKQGRLLRVLSIHVYCAPCSVAPHCGVSLPRAPCGSNLNISGSATTRQHRDTVSG